MDLRYSERPLYRLTFTATSDSHFSGDLTRKLHSSLLFKLACPGCVLNHLCYALNYYKQLCIWWIK